MQLVHDSDVNTRDERGAEVDAHPIRLLVIESRLQALAAVHENEIPKKRVIMSVRLQGQSLIIAVADQVHGAPRARAIAQCHLLWVPRSVRGRPARDGLRKTSGRDARDPPGFGTFGAKVDGIGL